MSFSSALSKISSAVKKTSSVVSKTASSSGNSSASSSSLARNTNSSQSVGFSKDSSSTTSRQTAAVLDRDPSDSASDPHASKVVTRRQSIAAGDLSGKNESSRPKFDDVESTAEDEKGDIRERIEPRPEGFKEGSDIPETPNLDGETPQSEEELPNGHKATFEHQGRQYTRVTKSDGSVVTSFERDGVTHRNTTYEDGRKEHRLRAGSEDSQHTRTVSYNSEGRTVGEHYTYVGQDATHSESILKHADGSSLRRSEKLYSSDRTFEDLAQKSIAPPEHLSNVGSLPRDKRSASQVREMELVSTDPTGRSRVEERQTSYTQASTDLGTELPEGSQIARTHTISSQRDQNDKLTTKREDSQSIRVVGNESGETILRDTWFPDGRSQTTFSGSGLNSDELNNLQQNTKNAETGLPAAHVTVGGKEINLVPPGGFAGLEGAGQRGEDTSWLQDAPNSRTTFDLNVTLERDAEGKSEAKNTSYSQLDQKGDGRTLARIAKGGETVFVRTQASNGGKDFARQTSVEGTEISVLERRTNTGPGTYRNTLVTQNGDEVLNSAIQERKEIRNLEQYIPEDISQEEYDRLKRSGEPVYLTQSSAHAAPLVDDEGEIVTDEDGKVIEPGHRSAYKAFSTQGYARSDFSATSFDPQGKGRHIRTEASSVADSESEPSFSSTFRESRRNPKSRRFERVESGTGEISVAQDGSISIDGEKQDQIDLNGKELGELLMQSPTFAEKFLTEAQTVAGQSKVTAAATGAADDAARIARKRSNLFLDHIESKGLNRLGRLTSISSVVGAAGTGIGLYQSVKSGDPLSIAEGGLGVVSEIPGLSSVAGQVASKAGFSNTGAALSHFGTASRFAGLAGPVVNSAFAGVSAYRAFKADSGVERASHSLYATSSALAAAGGIATLAGPSAIPFFVASGATFAAGYFVGEFQDTPPPPLSPVDERFFST